MLKILEFIKSFLNTEVEIEIKNEPDFEEISKNDIYYYN